MSTTLAVIDYGMGNLHSVAKALEHVAPRQRVILARHPHEIQHADRVVFPGQGAIGDCMRVLNELNLIEALKAAAANRPFLGLCLGPQALLEHSEENGGVECLGIMPGRVKRFLIQSDKTADRFKVPHKPSSARSGPSPVDYRATDRFKVPHMGWNQVRQTTNHALWRNIPQDSRFYFVHSYYLAPRDPAIIAGTTDYILSFTSVIAQDNIFAVQFHPEKSARAGLQLLENFSRWAP